MIETEFARAVDGESLKRDKPFDGEEFLRTLTSRPGVYRMLDERGRVIYVGKARNLKKRVSSYFRATATLQPKTQALMNHTARVEVTTTHTETEALLLENNLIKEHRPRYNILLRDDKSFPFIYLSTDQAFPRLSFFRGARSGKGRYYGPYASAGATRETLTQLQKLFRVRQCQDSFFNNRSRPCLQYQIKRCTAPCVGYIDASGYAQDVRHAQMFLEGKSEEMVSELVTRMEAASQSQEYELAARYRDQIQALRRVQERQYVSGTQGDVDVVAALAREGVAVIELIVIRNGQSLGSRSIFPSHGAGATSRDLLQAFLPQHYLGRRAQQPLPDEILVTEPIDDTDMLEHAFSEAAGHKVSVRDRVRSERARWIEMARSNAELAIARRIADHSDTAARFDALSEALDLPESTARIECFDISHTGGEATVASCVVFEREGALKSDYRRFNIKGVEAGDDYGAMRSALMRRYTRVKREEGRLPDLLLIDGGKGQLTQAVAVLQELQLEDIPVFAVSKGSARRPGQETLHTPGKPAIALAADSRALALIQQVRDEAHRFAITGHRARRAKPRKGSVLDDIPGIGPKRRHKLLHEFGGLQGLSRAGVQDLARVEGINRTLATAIYDAFRARG
ncbi:MAG: excinuclease ABC subunit UvrC [Gammaproteobacteria bacterium]|nr:excinuclease ABC subunit UvrC [Gammaproteobacteria bacterium]